MLRTVGFQAVGDADSQIMVSSAGSISLSQANRERAATQSALNQGEGSSNAARGELRAPALHYQDSGLDDDRGVYQGFTSA
jgi:hypothetical protein